MTDTFKFERCKWSPMALYHAHMHEIFVLDGIFPPTIHKDPFHVPPCFQCCARKAITWKPARPQHIPSFLANGKVVSFPLLRWLTGMAWGEQAPIRPLPLTASRPTAQVCSGFGPRLVVLQKRHLCFIIDTTLHTPKVNILLQYREPVS